MEPRYRIDFDAPRQLVHLRLAGQWDQRTLADYRRDLASAMRGFAAHGGRPGKYLLLIDVREQGVQSKDVAAEYQAIIADHVRFARRRALVMSESALHAMQVRRISPNADVNMFRTEPEALAWLMS